MRQLGETLDSFTKHFTKQTARTEKIIKSCPQTYRLVLQVRCCTRTTSIVDTAARDRGGGKPLALLRAAFRCSSEFKRLYESTKAIFLSV